MFIPLIFKTFQTKPLEMPTYLMRQLLRRNYLWWQNTERRLICANFAYLNVNKGINVYQSSNAYTDTNTLGMPDIESHFRRIFILLCAVRFVSLAPIFICSRCSICRVIFHLFRLNYVKRSCINKTNKQTTTTEIAGISL